ncbi:ubiquitin-conjugating enzyme E2 R2 [Galendromus occidentalis]|uniref:Ubiquitin-conjugating enzyme E2 R2 n=1 Tax=Galendromus occidentalis TaxID=34638 RepID=A0AAJ6QUG1_9ACAR|nr:ubiquitin-conjugating enzyme E2 R2 [Galendromus occidentalis]
MESVAKKCLQKELKKLMDEGAEGFTVKLLSEENIFEWEVGIFGPPQTLYEGGYFKLLMRFPANYPFSPPTVSFLTRMWHPNVYENGEICISILHPAGDDPHSGEPASERWNPAQSVQSVIVSVISLLNEPNTFSPANVDASVMYRKWKESKGENNDYVEYVRKIVSESQEEAARDGVKVPLTTEEYIATKRSSLNRNNVEDTDFGTGFATDDDYGYDEDDDESEGETLSETADSGNGDS